MGTNGVTIFPESLKAMAFGNEITGKTPTELYVDVMTAILRAYPHIIGQKETHFTTDRYGRARQYTGTTRNVLVGNQVVYIKTGLSTKDKWNGIKKTCELAGVSFTLSDGEIGVSVPSVQQPRSVNVVPEKKPDIAPISTNAVQVEKQPVLDDIIEEYIEILNLSLEDILYNSDSCTEYVRTLSEDKLELINHFNKTKEFFLKYDTYYKEMRNQYANSLISELVKYANKGYGSALYYAGVWFGSGIIGKGIYMNPNATDPLDSYVYKTFISEPYTNRMSLTIFKSSNIKSRKQADSLYALACLNMSLSPNCKDKARLDGICKILYRAKELGHKKAEILLRYFKQPYNEVYYQMCSPVGVDACGNRAMDGNSEISYVDYVKHNGCSNDCVIEYEGYLYYVKYDRKFNENKDETYSPFAICKKSITDDSSEIIIHNLRSCGVYDIFHEGMEKPRQEFEFGSHSYFGIYKNRIYFRELSRIFSMNLDGGDVQELPIEFKIAKKMYCPHAVESGILCLNQDKNISFYDYRTKTYETIAKSNTVVAVSDKEVYFASFKRNSSKMMVYDIQSKVTRELPEVYAGLGKHIAIHIDAEREIVYYIDDKCPDMSRDAIIGINKSGEIVDIWEKPHIFKNFFKETNYYNRNGIVFNGKNRIIVIGTRDEGKANSYISSVPEDCDFSLNSTILSCDRTGNVHCIYRGDPNKKEDAIDTVLKIIKDSVIITIFGSYTCETAAVPFDKFNDYHRIKMF